MTAEMSSTASIPRTTHPHSAMEQWHKLDLQSTNSIQFGRTQPQRDLLSEASRKVNAEQQEHYTDYWANEARQSGYDQTASILSLSDYKHSYDFIYCGYRARGRTFSCGNTLLCPRCSAIKLKWQTINEFSDRFHSFGLNCFLVTLSVNREADHLKRLQFVDHTLAESQQIKTGGFSKPDCFDTAGLPFATGDDLVTCHSYFQIFCSSIRETTGRRSKDLFQGSLCVPELAVSFTPQLQVRPHIHAIVWAVDFCGDDARELRRLVTRKIHDCRTLQGVEDNVHASVDVRRLTAREDFQGGACYFTKPIDLAGAYVRAAESVNFEAGAMLRLNADINAFLFNLPILVRGMRRVQRYGVCNSRNKAYIGVVTPWRARRRVQAAASRKRLREERVREGLPVNPPRKPPKSDAARLNALWKRWKDEPHRRPSRKFDYWRRFVSNYPANIGSSADSQFVPRTPIGAGNRAPSSSVPTSSHELN